MLAQIHDYSQISPLVSACLRPGVLTNCVLTPEDYRREIAAGTLLHLQWAGGLVFLRRREDFDLLNFYLNDPARLPDWQPARETVLELPRRGPGASPAAAFWENLGFFPLLNRVRLSRPKLPETPADPQAEISLAQAMSLLNSSFDPRTGCLPAAEWLAEDFHAGRVLVKTDGAEKLIGLLRYSRGSAAEIRHLAVAPAFRGQGVAKSLVAQFNSATFASRAQVWVREDYAAARSVYENSGFSPDGWISTVYTKECTQNGSTDEDFK